MGASTDAVSEEYAIGAAAAGYDPKALRHGSGPSVMAYLAARRASACATAGACGLLIQAVVAAHLNPSSFGGVNLITTLNGMYHKSGVYGDGEAFTESLAIQGLVAAGQTVPTAAVHHLVAAQDSDGGWDFLLIKDDPNGSTNFDTSDTNSTSMVLMALNAAGTQQSQCLRPWPGCTPSRTVTAASRTRPAPAPIPTPRRWSSRPWSPPGRTRRRPAGRREARPRSPS